jgi:hypothetical protein
MFKCAVKLSVQSKLRRNIEDLLPDSSVRPLILCHVSKTAHKLTENVLDWPILRLIGWAWYTLEAATMVASFYCLADNRCSMGGKIVP